MSKLHFILFTFLFSISSFTQTTQGSEIGIDGSGAVSTQGGSLVLGLKYGYKKTPEFIWGPSFRILRYWSNPYNSIYAGHYNVWGGGIYAHYRYQNILFFGGELEVLKNPFALLNNAKTQWVPTLFLGGGFSKEYKEMIRVNLSIFYDVINSLNSPFRTSYTIKKTNPSGQIIGYIPIIYRLSIFIPLNGKEKEDK